MSDEVLRQRQLTKKYGIWAYPHYARYMDIQICGFSTYDRYTDSWLNGARCGLMSAEIQGYPGAVVSLLKGGVTKSSLALNVGERLAARGNDVVLIDLDEDGHLTSLLGEEEALHPDEHIGDAMFSELDPEKLLIEMDFGIHLLPSTIELEEVNDKIKNQSFGVNRLRKNVVGPLADRGYDYFLIDPPGGRGLLHDSGFVAVQRALIPLIPRTGSINGLENLFQRTISPLRQEIPIDIVAITPNMMNDSIARESAEQMLARQLNTREQFRQYLPEYARIDSEVFEIIDKRGGRLTEIPKPGIRYRKAIDDAFRQGLPVAAYDSDCDQIANFDELADLVEEVSANGR